MCLLIFYFCECICFQVSFCTPRVCRCPQRLEDIWSTRNQTHVLWKNSKCWSIFPGPHTTILEHKHWMPHPTGPRGSSLKGTWTFRWSYQRKCHSVTGQNTMPKREIRQMVEFVNFTSLWAEYLREQFKKRKKCLSSQFQTVQSMVYVAPRWWEHVAEESYSYHHCQEWERRQENVRPMRYSQKLIPSPPTNFYLLRFPETPKRVTSSSDFSFNTGAFGAISYSNNNNEEEKWMEDLQQRKPEV